MRNYNEEAELSTEEKYVFDYSAVQVYLHIFSATALDRDMQLNSLPVV